MHTIIIESRPNNQYTEWKETVRARSISAARRKANRILWGAAADKDEVIKRQNQYDDSIEIWTII